jgi:two-component system, OmpR family, phosphate regulon sensor histidine kinase PhoR
VGEKEKKSKSKSPLLPHFLSPLLKVSDTIKVKNFLSPWRKKPADTPKSFALFEILKTMREGVIVVGEDTRVLASNQAAYDAFGRGNGALELKRLSEVIRDLSVHEAFRKALEEEAFSEVEFEFLFGEKRNFAVRVAPVDIDGEKSAVGIFYDLTQIARLEKVRQEFLSNVSHELRTPLTSILAFVETLEDGAIDDEENNRRFLSVIRKNANRMHRLIDDILELSSIEAGKVSVHPKEINLTALIAEVFTNLSAKAAEKRVKLENKVAKDIKVFADMMRLEQILTNLVDNAVKFNREGGSVVISHDKSDERDFIRITDTGEGIPGEHLQRIFERFYRTDRARSREIGGTGLGLAIVKHLARLHGGEVSAVSTPGKGSTFTLELSRPQK